MALLPLSALLGQVDRGDGSAGLPAAAPADPDALAEVARQAGVSQQNAAFAFQQLMNANAQPSPVVNPIAKFGANLAGNVSQAISPQMGGQEAANNTIQSAQDLLNKQHIVRLTLLANNYDKQAELARQQGNLVLEGKLAQQAAKFHGQLQEQLQGQLIASEEKRATQERQTQLQVAGIQQQTALGVENMRARAVQLDDLRNKGWVPPDNPADMQDPLKWMPPDGLTAPNDYQAQKAKLLASFRPMAGKPLDPASADRAAAEAKNLSLGVMLRNERDNPQAMVNRLLSEREPLPRYGTIPSLDIGRFFLGQSPIVPAYDIKKAPKSSPLNQPIEVLQRVQQAYGLTPLQAGTLLMKAGMTQQQVSDLIRQIQ